MITRNENLEIILSADVARQIIEEGFGVQELISEEAAQEALATLYVHAYNIEITELPFYAQDFKTAGLGTAITVESLNKRKLWEELKKAICKALQESTLIEKIIEVIVTVIANFMHLGILIKGWVKVIVKYLLNTGIKVFCAVE